MEIDLALLAVRLVIGGLLFGHGAQKLFGWYGGHGLAATGQFMAAHLRLRPAAAWALLAGLTEVGGGLLLALGFLSPLGSLGVIAAMLMAILLAHWGRLWASGGGMEYPLVLLTAAGALGLTGPGRLSLDAALGTALPEPGAFSIGLVLVLIGAALALATRAPRAVAADEGATGRSA